MEPIITLFHYELPLKLVTEYGGWRDKRLIEFYARFARTCFERYQGKVKYWILINQINLIYVCLLYTSIYGGRFYSQIDELIALVEEVNLENVGFCLDVGHANVDGVDIPCLLYTSRCV